MSFEKIYNCDLCTNKDIGDNCTLYIYLGSYIDAAGSLDRKIYEIDLCFKCRMDLLNKLFDPDTGKDHMGLDLTFRSNFVDYLKNKRKKYSK